MDPRDLARFRAACLHLAARARAGVPVPARHWSVVTVARTGPWLAGQAEREQRRTTRRVAGE